MSDYKFYKVKIGEAKVGNTDRHTAAITVSVYASDPGSAAELAAHALATLIDDQIEYRIVKRNGD